MKIFLVFDYTAKTKVRLYYTETLQNRTVLHYHDYSIHFNFGIILNNSTNEHNSFLGYSAV
jgi:hypothetical protein